MRRLALLALLLPLVASSATPCSETCKTLVDEGYQLSLHGQDQKAIEKYQAAMAVAPESTAPLLRAASLLLGLYWSATGPQAGKLHDMAEAMARQALRLAPGEALAQDILRQVLEGPPVVLHQPGAAAAQALRQAELLFAQRNFDAARKQYEAVMVIDPLWSYAWVGAGDCYFAQQDWAHAEALYRNATDIEPRNGQAWRYLADSLRKQGKQGPAAEALYAAIAANPADRNTWAHMASLRQQARMPLTSLHLQRSSSVIAGAGGNYTINIDEERLQKNATPDTAFALSLALLEAGLRIKDAAKTRSAYDIELEAWRTALQAAGEQTARSGTSLSDPALLQMQAFARDGQLEPALLILAYSPSYRPAFDAWLAAHPGGVKAFIDRYALQP